MKGVLEEKCKEINEVLPSDQSRSRTAFGKNL